jgi:hypothetical protein
MDASKVYSDEITVTGEQRDIGNDTFSQYESSKINVSS